MHERLHRFWVKMKLLVPWWKLIVHAHGVLRKTVVVDDWCFGNLWWSHLQSQGLDFCTDQNIKQQSFLPQDFSNVDMQSDFIKVCLCLVQTSFKFNDVSISKVILFSLFSLSGRCHDCIHKCRMMLLLMRRFPDVIPRNGVR